MLARHLAPGEKIIAVPAPVKTIEIPAIQFGEAAPLLRNLGMPVKSEKPLDFEALNQGYGYVLYRTKVAGPVDATLVIKDLRDYAVVMVDGKRVAVLDRRHKQDSTPLKIDAKSATLDILVENGGRINYGREIPRNHKGITESVTLGDRELTGWEMFKLPFDSVADLKFAKARADIAAPFVARGTFELAKVGDVFLDMRGWGKGIVFVNGHNLGRFWYIGPQQTLYCPGVWLKKGKNEIVVLEQIKDGLRTVTGIKEPVLNQLVRDENTPPPRSNGESKSGKRPAVYGDLLHGECAYIHNLRQELFALGTEGDWRRNYHWEYNGNLYPTHGLGPVCQYMGVGRGDQLKYIVSASSPERSLTKYRNDHHPNGGAQDGEKYICGDINTSILKTEKGLTIMLQHDVVLPRPYSRINALCGTDATFFDYPARLAIDAPKQYGLAARGSEDWLETPDMKIMRDKFTHPLWAKLRELSKGGGHGGMDYVMNWRLLNCLRRGVTPDSVVYDAAAWSCIIETSVRSVANGSAPVNVPDFTRGLWKTMKPLPIVEA